MIRSATDEEVVRLSFDGKVVAIAALDGNIIYCAEKESETIFGLDHKDILSENVGNLLDSRFDASEFHKLCNARGVSEFEKASVLKTRNKVLVWADRVLASLVRSIWGSPAATSSSSSLSGHGKSGVQVPPLVGPLLGSTGRTDAGAFSAQHHCEVAYSGSSGYPQGSDPRMKTARPHVDQVELSFNDVFGESSEDLDDSISDATCNSLSTNDGSVASISHQIALDRINSQLSLTRLDSDRAISNGALIGPSTTGALLTNPQDIPLGDDSSWGWFLPLSPRTSSALSAGMASQLRVI
jgi:hypothetical protein